MKRNGSKDIESGSWKRMRPEAEVEFEEIGENENLNEVESDGEAARRSAILPPPKMVFPNNFPKTALIPISKYLDPESADSFSKVCKKVDWVVRDFYPWEKECRALRIPRCLPSEHADQVPWNITCSDPTHTWQRAYQRRKSIMGKWESGELETLKIPEKHLWGEEAGYDWDDRSLIAYEEWVIFKKLFYHPTAVIMNLNAPGEIMKKIVRKAAYLDRAAVMPLPNQPALLIIPMFDYGRIYMYELDGEEFPCVRVLEAYERDVGITSMAISSSSSNPGVPDERFLLASCSETHIIKVWNALNGECLHVFSGNTDMGIKCMVFCDDDIVGGAYDLVVRIWSIDGILKHSIHFDSGLYINELRYDGIWLIVSSLSEVRIWNMEDAQSEGIAIRTNYWKNYFASGEMIYAVRNNLYAYNYERRENSLILTEAKEIMAFEIIGDAVVTVTSDNIFRVRNRQNVEVKFQHHFESFTHNFPSLTFMQSTGRMLLENNRALHKCAYIISPKHD